MANEGVAMAERTVVVHAGPLWEVQLLQGLLEEEGIRAFIPDQIIKHMDPFATGANPLATNLVVARADAQRAAALIERRKDDARGPAGRAPPRRAPTETERLATLGTRIRWSSIFAVTAPLALCMGFVYLVRLRRGGTRPRQHGLTIAAIVLSIVWIGLFVWLLWIANTSVSRSLP